MSQVDYKKLIWISTLVALISLIIFINIQGLKIGFNLDTLGLIGTVTGINWFLWGLLKKWLWKASFLHSWLVKIPDLNGEWTGTLQSTWEDPSTKKGLPPIVIDAVIKQDLTRVTVDITSNEMNSKSILAEVSCDQHRGVAEITYTYQSEPGALVKHRSAIHFGTAKLVYKQTKNTETLVGDYWTDRKTTGSISLKRKR